MKKVLFLLLSLVFAFSTSLFSQNLEAKNSKMIVGKWKVDSLDIGDFQLSPQYEYILKEKLPQIIESTEVHFYPNKKYFKKGLEGTIEGKWSVSKDGQFVSVKTKGKDKEDKTKIISLTEDKLIIAPEDPNAANSKVYLYKVK
ncbi:MAG: hypothetical protein RBR32_07535 [Bacteroidales bacterium]|jgi:hypothetical protein|nr:hypothetical protein [Bacteroidales bacterium]